MRNEFAMNSGVLNLVFIIRRHNYCGNSYFVLCWLLKKAVRKPIVAEFARTSRQLLLASLEFSDVDAGLNLSSKPISRKSN